LEESDHPALGKVKIVTTYRYTGAREADGATLEAFAPTITFDATGGAATVTVEEQESNGEVLFNRTAGRLESKSIKFAVHLAIEIDGKAIKQTIELSSEHVWLPDEE
jgi:hypothetical protein